MSLLLPIWKSLGLVSSRANGGRGRKKEMGFFDSHVLDRPVHCWSAWVCRNWPPVSSKCLQKLENRGVYKLLGARGNQRCQPPSTWSYDTRIWDRERERRIQRQMQRERRLRRDRREERRSGDKNGEVVEIQQRRVSNEEKLDRGGNGAWDGVGESRELLCWMIQAASHRETFPQPFSFCLSWPCTPACTRAS